MSAPRLVGQTCQHVTWSDDCEACLATAAYVATFPGLGARVFACVMRHDSYADQVQDIAEVLVEEGFIVP